MTIVERTENIAFKSCPRFGFALKNSIDIGTGVIDDDYRGPVGVILFNHSHVDFQVMHDDRISQLILQKIMTPEGFGS